MKNRLFQEKNREIDMRTREYQWQVRGIRDVHPPLYYIWHCPQCYFAASSRRFEAPFENTSVPERSFRTTVSEAQQSDAGKEVIALLSDGLSSDEVNHVTALRQHLLAIYHHAQVHGLAHGDAMDIARYTLRTAWLWRELEENSKLGQLKREAEELVRRVQSHWKFVPTGDSDALEKSVGFYKTALTQSGALETARDEVELVLHISRIYMKLGEITEARSFLQTSRSKMQQFEETTKKKARGDGDGPTLSDEEVAKANSEARRMNLTHEKVQDLFEDIRAEWEDAQREKGKKLLEKAGGRSYEDTIAYLVENGVDEQIAKKVTPKPTKKKKVLGLF